MPKNQKKNPAKKSVSNYLNSTAKSTRNTQKNIQKNKFNTKSDNKAMNKKKEIKKEIRKKESPKESVVSKLPEPAVIQQQTIVRNQNTKSNFKVRPLGDRILIKEDNESKEEKTASGIIIPISAQEEKGSKRGKVIAVGEGKIENGNLIPVEVNIGDVVLFQWGDKIKVDNEEYYLVRESEVLAVIRS